MVRWMAVCLLACGVVRVAGGQPEEGAILEGRVLGNEGGEGVWLGVVGAAPENQQWTFVEGAEFKVALPADEAAVLVAVAKGRVPLLVPVPVGRTAPVKSLQPDARGAPSPEIELRLRRGIELDVRVRSDNDAPLAGARIAVVPGTRAVLNALAKTWYDASLLDVTVDLSRDGHTAQVPPAQWPVWHTDRDGAVRVAGLEAGLHLVQATLDGHVRVVRSVDVHAGAPNRLAVTLSKEHFVAGEVVDVDGTGISGVTVTAQWHQHKGVDYLEPDGALHTQVALRHVAVETDEAGAFRLGPFEAESNVGLFATSEALGSSMRQTVLVPSEGVKLRLRRHLLRGRVVDAATGEPVAAFQTVLDRAPNTAHQDGHFEMLVAPQTEWLRIEAPTYIPHFITLFTDQASEYDLGETALARERPITGRVRDANTLQPVAGARVRRSPSQYTDRALRHAASNRSVWSTTAADGTFALNALSTRTDVLEVTARGGRKLVELPPDTVHVEIDMSFGEGVIAGSLVFEDGTPATGVVDLDTRGWDYLRQQDVAADGSFRWKGLEAGEYRIEANSFDGVVDGRVVTLRHGETVDGLVLRVDPAGRMTGAITGLFRNEYATIEVRERKGRLATTRSFRNGPFTMQGIPAEFVGKAQTPNGRGLVFEGQLNEQGETRLHFDFTARARLTGIVTAQGRPLAGIRLAVLPEDRSQPIVHTQTNDAGRYVAAGISNGPHAVATDTGREFHVDVAGSATLDVELPPNQLSGTVRAAGTGRVVAGAWVSLKLPEGGSPRKRRGAAEDGPWVSLRPPEGGAPAISLHRQVASDGAFRFEGLDAREYQLRVRHGDFAELSQRIVVDGRQTVSLELAPQP